MQQEKCQRVDVFRQTEPRSRHWRTKLVKCLKDKYDVFEKSIDAHSQFSGFFSRPVSAAEYNTCNKTSRDMSIMQQIVHNTQEVCTETDITRTPIHPCKYYIHPIQFHFHPHPSCRTYIPSPFIPAKICFHPNSILAVAQSTDRIWTQLLTKSILKPWLHVKQNCFEIILKFFKCFVSHVTASETEIKLFQPQKEL